MMISSKGRYALRVMLDMAERYPDAGGGENDKSLHRESPGADENNKVQSGESRKDGAAGALHGGKPGELTPGGDGYMRLNEIATRQGISKKYLESIMTVLTKSGLVESAVGKTGGYRLCRAPDGYTGGVSPFLRRSRAVPRFSKGAQVRRRLRMLHAPVLVRARETDKRIYRLIHPRGHSKRKGKCRLCRVQSVAYKRIKNNGDTDI